MYLSQLWISQAEQIFQFKVKHGPIIWHKKRHFNYDSKIVVYTVIYNTCEWFYLGHTINLKQQIRKHKSDVFYPQNSFCKKCSEHLRDFSRMKETFLEFIHFYMRIKKNYASLKNVSLWDGNHSWTLINKSLKYN